VDSQPKTQRSGWEKTKCKHTVSNPNYSTGRGWKWGKRGRAPPFIGETLLFLPPLHGCTSARARGRTTRVHARPRGRAVTGPRGPAPARTHYRIRTDAVFTVSAGKIASAGKCGRTRTSGQKGRPDGHFHPKTSFMTSLPCVDESVSTNSRQLKNDFRNANTVVL
jgi:hypothetical protein